MLLFSFLLPDLSQSQSKLEEDEVILRLLDRGNAFCSWRMNWENMMPKFSLEKFHIHSESVIRPRSEVKSSFANLQEAHHLPLISFSPDGRKAVDAFGNSEVFMKDGVYEIAFDDYKPILLYDLEQENVYELVSAGLYGPAVNGLAWMNDNLLVAVGAIWKLGDSDSVAAAVIILDLKEMKMRTLSGDFLQASYYYKNRTNTFAIEPTLMFKHSGR